MTDKPPAEKCAERIAKSIAYLGIDTAAYAKDFTAIIQSEYAETFQVAREALQQTMTAIDCVTYERKFEPTIHAGNAVGEISNGDLQRLELARTQLRTAMELMPK